MPLLGDTVQGQPKTLLQIVKTTQKGKISKRVRLMKGAVPGSFEHRKNIVEPAVCHAAGFRCCGDPWEGEWAEKEYGNVVATFPEYAIVCGGYDGEGGFWKVPYSYDEEKKEATAGTPVEVEQVYCDADTGKVVTDAEDADGDEEGSPIEDIMLPV